MSQSVLKDELVELGLYDNESDAVSAWAQAFRGYFENAETNSIPIITAGLDVPQSAMAGAMVGLSTDGAAKIQAGITQWWATLALAPSTYWATATVITPPPGLSGIATVLQAVFSSNISTSASKTDAMNAIAGVLHTNNLGGTATFPGQAPFPIL